MSQPERVILYWPRGVFFWRPKAMYAEGYLFHGNRHGKWVFWYRSGHKQLEGEYKKGKKTGTWIKWTEKGTKISQGEFFSDKMHGVWTDWYGTGQKAMESQWSMGKRDGTWTYWEQDGSLKKVNRYDHRHEQDKGYSIHTDLEAKELVRQIQREDLNRSWERVAGRFIASLVKPWQIACCILIFVPTFSLINAGSPWRSAALAATLACAMTSLLTWLFEERTTDKPGQEERGRGEL